MTLPISTAALWTLVLLAVLGGVQLGLVADDPADVPEHVDALRENVSESYNESYQNATAAHQKGSIEYMREGTRLLYGPIELVGLGVAGIAEVLEGHGRAIADLLALAGGVSGVWIVREVGWP